MWDTNLNQNMRIEVRLAVDAEEMAQGDVGCAVCLVPFEADAVQVQVMMSEAPLALCPLCPACIEHLGKRNPDRFITIEEYEELTKRYLEPILDYVPPDDVWERVYHYEAVIVGG